MTTTAKSSPSSKSHPTPKDAIALLKADHEAVSTLFADYEKTHSVAKKKALGSEICTALSVHAQIEEEIFYPDVKAALRDKLLVPEATVEHAGVKVKVLSEYVKHHVKEEQNEMFPKVKESSLDLVELGTRMASRKADLLAEHG